MSLASLQLPPSWTLLSSQDPKPVGAVWMGIPLLTPYCVLGAGDSQAVFGGVWALRRPAGQ